MATNAPSASWTGSEPSATRSDVTRQRLLDAAATLFGERGYTGTSIRAVTKAAGVSVSAANYHFGSKRELLHAVCQRMLGAVNDERMSQLDELERREHSDGLSLEELLRVFLTPVLAQPPDRRLESRAVAARLYADPPEVASDLRDELFGPLRDRMQALLARALPEGSPDQIALGFQFTVGAMVHVVGGHVVLDPAFGAASDERLLDALVTHCAAGIRAQLASTAEGR
jgi:AcrR family transcriptional regulator